MQNFISRDINYLVMTKTGWYNRNKTGNTPKYEAHRHSLASRGIKTSAPKGVKGVSSAFSPTPNFDMVAKIDKNKSYLDYLKFSKKNVISRLYLVGKIKDPIVLRKIAYNDKSMFVQAIATSHIIDQNTLKGIALRNETSPAGASAIYNITDIEFLKNLERRYADNTARGEAVKLRLIRLLEGKTNKKI